jgi:hypothetical protein
MFDRCAQILVAEGSILSDFLSQTNKNLKF